MRRMISGLSWPCKADRLNVGGDFAEINGQIRALIGVSQLNSALWYICILITLFWVPLAAWTLGKLPQAMAPLIIALTTLWAS